MKVGFNTSFLRHEWRIIVANIVVFALAVSGWNYYDVRYFINYWFDYFKEGRLLEIYSGPLRAKVAYPPLAVYLFISTHFIASSIGGDLAVRLIDKLPLIIAFNCIYFILRRRYGALAGNLWLLNYIGYAIIASFQFDLVAVLFLLMGFIYLTEGRYVRSTIMIVLSALIKQLLAVFFLFIPLILLARRDYRNMAKSIGVAALTASLFILPFLIYDPWGFINKVVLFHGSRYPQYYSLWALPVYLSWFNLASLPSWLTWVWIIPFILALLIVYVDFYRKGAPQDPDVLLVYFTVTSILLLLLNKVGNVNYYLWASLFITIYLSRGFPRLPSKLLSLYIFIPLLIGLIAGFFIEVAAAIVGDDILIVEDSNWVSAEQLIALSVGIDSIIYKFIIYTRSSPVFYTLFSILNSGRGISATLITIIYNAYLIYMLILLTSSPPFRMRLSVVARFSR